jgi:hypothetical protein
MKKFLFMMLAIPMVFAACSKDEAEPQPQPTPDPTPKPALTLTSDAEMSFEANGGNGIITYTLTNPTEGVVLTANCEADWISNLTAGDNVVFVVAANEGEARETTIAVAYDTLSFDVTVKQAAKVEEPNYEVDMMLAAAARIPSEELGIAEHEFALLFVDDSENVELGFIVTGSEGDNVLQSGTYNAIAEAAMYLYDQDAEYLFTEGEVVVEVDEEIYNFDILLVDESDKLYHFTYTGSVIDMDSTGGVEQEEFEPVRVCSYRESGWERGNFELQLYINDTQYHSLDMMDKVAPNDNYLSAGEYSYADGTITSWSNFIANVATGEGAYLAAAEITLTHNEDGTSSIVGYIESEYGVRLNIDWRGVVEGFTFDGQE